jgi:biotin carboxyl carrier protein
VEAGQVLLVIEAMKMKNSIRSTRAGKIVEVLVIAGETVTHKQPLVRFG